MTLPRTHSFRWSDSANGQGSRPETDGPDRLGPVSLKDKELQMWVVYPNARQAKKRGGRPQSHRKDLRLWAVVILEDLKQIGDFTYEVKLKRIFKAGERSITIWVRNAPEDQSEDASVFGVLSPDARLLSYLEECLANLAAKRVYDAIADTWSRQASQTSVLECGHAARQ